MTLDNGVPIIKHEKDIDIYILSQSVCMKKYTIHKVYCHCRWYFLNFAFYVYSRI